MGTGRKLEAYHGIICSLAHERFGYFGWPSVARLEDGTLVTGASGYRTKHVCPWGKTVLFFSGDDGRTWSAPRIVNDTPIDDRDVGVVALGESKLLVTWFTSDTRQYLDRTQRQGDIEKERQWRAVLSTWSDELVADWLGSWVRLSSDGGRTWEAPVRVPVTAPHGPAVLKNGDLLYLGRGFGRIGVREREAGIMACRSGDDGRTWEQLGAVPLCQGCDNTNLHEPHVVELPSGKLLGMIRYQHGRDARRTHLHFSLFQTESDDGGATWSPARPLDIAGSPPHLLLHSAGTLVCVYGCRLEPYGQRVMISADEGRTWDHDWILRDDGPDSDLGYPGSTELPDGSILTVYYQKVAPGENCAILWSRWRLPQ